MSDPFNSPRRKSGPSIYYEPEYDNLGRMTRAFTYRAGTPPVTITDFGYTYEADDNNIAAITFDHRPDAPYNAYTYDNLDRLTQADYLVGLQNQNEVFGMDDLGNRTTVNLRSGSNQVYDVNDLTNRYLSIDQAPLEYDAAGNLTADHDGYRYVYDYENRITRIFKLDGETDIDVALYAYDALGRRIWKYDPAAAAPDVYYYHNDQWQVLAEYTGDTACRQWFAYGNYIDEVLSSSTHPVLMVAMRYYAHDHLYSPAALTNASGMTVWERYEYDAYGKVTITARGTDNLWYTADDVTLSASAYNNPFFFTGRQLDTLNGGNLKIMHYRHRDYNPEMGRFMQHDPLGITPNLLYNPFLPKAQFYDGFNLYQYVTGATTMQLDAFGLDSICYDAAGDEACLGDVAKDYDNCMGNAKSDRDGCYKKATELYEQARADCDSLAFPLDIGCLALAGAGAGKAKATCFAIWAGTEAGCATNRMAGIWACSFANTHQYACDDCPAGMQKLGDTNDDYPYY